MKVWQSAQFSEAQFFEGCSMKVWQMAQFFEAQFSDVQFSEAQCSEAQFSEGCSMKVWHMARLHTASSHNIFSAFTQHLHTTSPITDVEEQKPTFACLCHLSICH